MYIHTVIYKINCYLFLLCARIPVVVNIFTLIVLYYVVEEPVKINLTEAELIWNSSSLAYSLKLSWTVPQIYNLSHLILLFKILDLNNPVIRNPDIPAVRTIGLHKVDML